MADKTRDEELWEIREEYPLLYPITLVTLVVIILLLAGRAIYSTPDADQAWGYGVNVFTSVISTVFTVGIIEVFNRRRYKHEDAAEREAERRQQLLIDAASLSNETAKNAVHQLWRKGLLHGEEGLLAGADLTAANLADAGLMRANLQSADLRSANLQSANLILSNLQGAQLQSAKLQGARLNSANLRGADLKDTNFQGADSFDAHFEGANLQFAKLQKSSFLFAHLISADLSGAELEGADFTLAELRDAKLRAARWDESTRLPDGQFWTPETDMERFTDIGHPHFYQPDF